MRAFNDGKGRAHVTQGGTKEHRDALGHWRSYIKSAAQERFKIMDSESPWSITAVFLLVRSASLPKGVTHPIKARSGDLDKLSRAVNDALEGVVYKDDSQIVDLNLKKRYVQQEQQTGVHLWIAKIA